MKPKLILSVLIFILFYQTKLLQGSKTQFATHSEAYPFHALIEVSLNNGSVSYVNGVFATLQWVMAVSHILASYVPEEDANDTVLSVYGSLDEFTEKTLTTHPLKKPVIKVVTNPLVPEDSMDFPNLVLLQLDSPFSQSNTLKPAIFNVGKLSQKSMIVGFATEPSGSMIPQLLAIPVECMSANQCATFNAFAMAEEVRLEFKEQFCAVGEDSGDSYNVLFPYSGLLVDQNEYITGLIQFPTGKIPKPGAMSFMILVRLSFFKPFWEFYAEDIQEEFLETDFNDDFRLEPWDPQGKGIGLEYIQGGCTKIKEIDLSELTSSTDIEELAFRVAKGEPLITPNIHHQLVGSLERLQGKIFSTTFHKFYRHKTLKTHLLPITNVAFDKSGKKCLTGSYDRTCKVWDIETGEEIHTLQGHKNVVYAVTFNNLGDKILTGSFDKTCLLWSADTGECRQSFTGHSGEVVAVQFDPQKQLIATASMDTTARLYNVSTGQEVSVLQGHTGEIISLQYNNSGSLILTGSFDNTLGLWDSRTNSKVGTLSGHTAEISSCLFSQDESLVVSGSLDKSARVWDVRTLTSVHSTEGHQDEVLDVAVDLRSCQLATASSDSTVCLWDVKQSCALVTTLTGHSQEVSKVCFNPAGTAVLTASQDHTARLWDPSNGQCLQVLEGHSDDVFSCAFSYYGDTIITASKDNTCRIWQNTVNK